MLSEKSPGSPRPPKTKRTVHIGVRLQLIALICLIVGVSLMILGIVTGVNTTNYNVSLTEDNLKSVAQLKTSQVSQAFRSMYYQVLWLSSREQVQSSLTRYRSGNNSESNWQDLTLFFNSTLGTFSSVGAVILYDLSTTMVFNMSNSSNVGIFEDLNPLLFPLKPDGKLPASFSGNPAGYVSGPYPALKAFESDGDNNNNTAFDSSEDALGENHSKYMLSITLPVQGNTTVFVDNPGRVGYITVLTDAQSFIKIINDTTGMTEYGQMILVAADNTSIPTNQLTPQDQYRYILPPTKDSYLANSSYTFSSYMAMYEALTGLGPGAEVNVKTPGTHVAVGYSPCNIQFTTWAVGIEEPHNTVYANIEYLRNVVIGTAFGIAGFVILITIPLARFAVKPVYRLRTATEKTTLSFVYEGDAENKDPNMHTDSLSAGPATGLQRAGGGRPDMGGPGTGSCGARHSNSKDSEKHSDRSSRSSKNSPKPSLSLGTVTGVGSYARHRSSKDSEQPSDIERNGKNSPGPSSPLGSGLLVPHLPYFIRGKKRLFQHRDSGEYGENEGSSSPAAAAADQGHVLYRDHTPSASSPITPGSIYFGRKKEMSISTSGLSAGQVLASAGTSSSATTGFTAITEEGETSPSGVESRDTDTTFCSGKEGDSKEHLNEKGDTDEPGRSKDDKARPVQKKAVVKPQAGANESNHPTESPHISVIHTAEEANEISAKIEEHHISESQEQGLQALAQTLPFRDRVFNVPMKVKTRNGLFKDELSDLSRTYNSMIDELITQYTNLEDQVRERTRELESAKTQAELANEAKSVFIANITHELRTPLNGILGLTAVSLTEKDVGKIQRSLNLISKSGEVLLELLTDLLTFSRNQVGHVVLEEREFQIREVIERLAIVNGERAKERDIEMTFEFYPTTNIQSVGLVGDAHRISQVVMNLVNNALKFTPAQGKVTVRTRLIESPRSMHHYASSSILSTEYRESSPQRKLAAFSKQHGMFSKAIGGRSKNLNNAGESSTATTSATGGSIGSSTGLGFGNGSVGGSVGAQSGQNVGGSGISPTNTSTNRSMMDFVAYLQFEIEDTGKGIDQNLGKQIFEPFLQGENSLTRKYGGTGLGLSICKQLTDLLGGSINYTSKVNVGSTFVFRVPVKSTQPIFNGSGNGNGNGGSGDLNRNASVDSSRSHVYHYRQFSASGPSKSGSYFSVNSNGPTQVQSAASGGQPHVGSTPSHTQTQAGYSHGVTPSSHTSTPYGHGHAHGHGHGHGHGHAHGHIQPVQQLISSVANTHSLSSITTSTTTTAGTNTSAGDGESAVGTPIPGTLAGQGISRNSDDDIVLRVLIADDNLINQEILKRMLRLELITDIDMALDGEKAIRLVEKTRKGKNSAASYDIVFMDLKMPKIDGVTATKTLRESDYDGIIIAVTAFADRETELMCLEAGMDDVLTKPISRSQLHALLRKHFPNSFMHEPVTSLDRGNK